MYGELYYISLYLQGPKLMSSIMTGVGLLPVSITFMPTSIAVALTISRTGRYRWALWLGWVATITAAGVLITLSEHTSTVAWIFIFAAVGVGHGILFNALLIAAQACSPPKEVAFAASMYTFWRTLGFAIGVVIGGTVLQNLMASKLSELGLSTEIAHNAENYVLVLKQMPPGSELREKVIGSYIHGIRGVFIVATAIAAVGLVVAPLIAKRPLKRP